MSKIEKHSTIDYVGMEIFMTYMTRGEMKSQKIRLEARRRKVELLEGVEQVPDGRERRHNEDHDQCRKIGWSDSGSGPSSLIPHPRMRFSLPAQ